MESDTLSDRRTVCLRRGSDAFARFGEVLATARPENLVDLVRASQSLPNPALCSELDAFTSDVAPPRRELAASVDAIRTQLTRARVDLDSGLYTEARNTAKTGVANARVLDYKPVLAEALLLEGRAQAKMQSTDDDRVVAAPLFTEAISIALAAHADSIAIEAWARRAWAIGTTNDKQGALDGLELIALLAERTPSITFARALLYNNIGIVELARGDRIKARDAFERALTASRGFTGDGSIELIAIRTNLALVTEDRVVADSLIADAEAERTSRLGNHRAARSSLSRSISWSFRR